MVKGIDYTGVVVSYYCHDGEGNFVMHRRSTRCRDEHGVWDFGGGGLRFGETLADGLVREVYEEYGTLPLSYELMGFDEVFREHEGTPTHWIGFRYKVLVEREKVVNGEPEKHEEVQWFTLDALPVPLHSQLPQCLKKYNEQLRKEV